MVRRPAVYVRGIPRVVGEAYVQGGVYPPWYRETYVQGGIYPPCPPGYYAHHAHPGTMPTMYLRVYQACTSQGVPGMYLSGCTGLSISRYPLVYCGF